MRPVLKPSADSCRLMVNNLSETTKEQDIRSLFQLFGPCEVSLVVKEPAKVASALVTYADSKNASTAREALNFRTLNGKEMLIVPFDPNMVKYTKSTIFVRNLGPSVTNKFLYDLFKEFGEIFSVRTPQDQLGNPKGHGSIQFRNIEDALRAIKAMNGREINGRKLMVDIYKTSDQRDRNALQQPTNIYVKCLPPDVTGNQALDDMFSQFGPRTSVAIFPKEHEGKIKYYGFVNFKKAEDAANAVAAMNGREIKGTKLFVKWALTKEQKEKTKRDVEIRTQYMTSGVADRTQAMPMQRPYYNPSMRPVAAPSYPSNPQHASYTIVQSPSYYNYVPPPPPSIPAARSQSTASVTMFPTVGMSFTVMPTVGMTPGDMTNVGISPGMPLQIITPSQYMHTPAKPEPQLMAVETFDKEDLYDCLYVKVQQVINPKYRAHVAKITLLLMEQLPLEIVLDLPNDDDILRARIDRAIELLESKTGQ